MILSISSFEKEELFEIADFEKELGIGFTRMAKADAKSLEENNTLLWAKKIFKTKPNHEFSSDVKKKVHTIFHHLTKEELIEKALAKYLSQSKTTQDTAKKSKMKNPR